MEFRRRRNRRPIRKKYHVIRRFSLSLSFPSSPFCSTGFWLELLPLPALYLSIPLRFFSLFFKEYQTEIGTTRAGEWERRRVENREKREGNDETRQHRIESFLKNKKNKPLCFERAGKKEKRYAEQPTVQKSLSFPRNLFFVLFSQNAKDQMMMTSLPLKFFMRGKSKFFGVYCSF